MPKDPVMLLSFINMKLRDEYKDMDALCEALDADRAQIDSALVAIGYRYDEGLNQYR